MKNDIIEASINGQQVQLAYMQVEYRTTKDGDVPNRLIIFTESSDLMADFCTDGEPVEIQWKDHNGAAGAVVHKVGCQFETSRLTNAGTMYPMLGTGLDKNLLESRWHIFRWQAEINNNLAPT